MSLPLALLLPRIARTFSPAALIGALGLLLGAGIAMADEQSCVGQDLLASASAEQRQALAAELSKVPYAEGNIWQATATDGSKLTLVGTMHLADPRQAAQLAQIAPLLQSAEVLVVEASPATEAELLARIANSPSLAFLTSGPSLLERLGPEDWERFAAEMAARGVPSMVAAKFQPWYAMLTLSIPQCLAASLRGDGKEGLDRQLIAQALDLGIPLAALEDLDLLLGSLVQGTPEEQLERLRLALRTNLASTDMVVTMLNSYFAGRHRESWVFWRHIETGLSEVDRLSVEAEMMQMETALLRDRNLDWIGKILAKTAGKTAVIAVGAAHLSDWHGLLNQLERRGYSLTRLDH